MTPNLLQLLVAGEYLCPVRYPEEFHTLNDSVDASEDVNRWLGKLDLRLARVCDDGAFFAAPSTMTDKVTTKIKGELKEFRDVYGPALRMIDYIRQVKAENALCVQGERIQLVELESLVTQSATLSAQLRALLDVIHNGNPRVSDRENLHRLLAHLAKDGYVILIDKGADTYQVTGKVEQLYAALRFLDDNKVIEQDEVDDQLELDGEGGDT